MRVLRLTAELIPGIKRREKIERSADALRGSNTPRNLSLQEQILSQHPPGNRMDKPAGSGNKMRKERREKRTVLNLY